MTHIVIPFNVEVSAKASSNYTQEQVERRIAALRLEPPTANRDRELAFLIDVMRRDFA